MTVTIVPVPPSSSSTQARVPVREARSTMYKRLKREKEGTAKRDKVITPRCALCQTPIQGHKKYKKMTWCEVAKQSTSKTLQGQSFRDYAHFQEVVHQLKISINLPIYLYFYLLAQFSIYIYISTCPSTMLDVFSIYLSTCPFIYLSIYLSIYL